MSVSKRVVAIIISLSVLFLTVATTGVVMLVKEINKPKALTGDAALSIGNMLKDGNTVNYDTYQKLIDALGGDTTSIRNSASINNGNPIVFQMGTVTDSSGNENPIYWQVVYQTADYITVWMTNSYTAEYFNNSGMGSDINNSALAGYSTGPYSNNGNYSQSVLHDVTKGIYNALSASSAYPVLSKIVAAPSTVATVNDWQSTQNNAYYDGTTWSITNGLGTNTYTGGGTSSKSDSNPFNWSYSNCMGDKFWIPSHYEVCNIDTATSASDTNGFWGLTSSTYIKDNSSTALDGTSTSQNCWLRSGYSSYGVYAMRVNSSGLEFGYGHVFYSNGVRPACHISLSALKGCSIGNLLKDGNEISYEAYQSLLSLLDNDTTSIRNSASINGGSPVIFQMGEVLNTTTNQTVPIYWQVVYQVGDIITVWMTDCYTTEQYNSTSSSRQISSNNLTLLQKYISSNYKSYNQSSAYNTYSQYSNYSQSVLRDLTNAIYLKLAEENPVLTEVVKSPSAAGATWQETTTAQPDSYYTSTSYSSHHNALKDPSGTGYYTSEFVWDTETTGPYYDSFWIPSWYETMNSSTTTASLNGGLWGLTAEERGYNDGSDSSSTIKSLDGTAYNSSSYIYPNRCWLRSGRSNDYGYAMRVNSSGSAGYSVVTYSNGVRPAAHLSLSALLRYAKFVVQTNTNNNTMGTTTGDVVFSRDDTGSATITATPNYGYAFNYWFEESTSNKIYSNPYTFTVTKSEIYTAYFYAVEVAIASDNNKTEIEYEVPDCTTTTYNFAIKFNTSNYITQIKFTGDSVPRSIKGIKGTFGDIANCTAVDYTTNTEGSKLYLSVLDPTDSITITLYFTNIAQNYKATSGGGGVEGVAIQTRLSGGDGSLVCYGEARICGYSTLDDLDYVHISAVAYSGYAFSHWEIDGEALDSATYLISANVPVSLVKDKMIVAVFTENSAKTNTDTNTPDTGGFVQKNKIKTIKNK